MSGHRKVHYIPTSPEKKDHPRPSSDSSKDKVEISVFREKIAELIEKNPEKAALILTDWIKKTVKKKSA